MKITEFGTVTNTSNVTKRGSTTGSTTTFSDLLDAAEAQDTAPASQANDVASASALNNLLALQEISEEEIQRKKLVRKGSNLLDSLDNLRRQFLTGTVPAHTLLDISRQLAEQKQLVNDPHLNEIIEDIELRAAVELAKLETALQRKIES